MSRDARVAFGTVLAGAVVALAVTAALILAGAGIAASAGELDVANFSDLRAATPLAGAWVGIAAAAGAFIGGRAAAMSSRSLVRRDGAMAGLVTGSVLALASLVPGGFAAFMWPVSRAAELIWALCGLVIVCLVSAILGGMSGARSEARAIGLRTVTFSRHGLPAGDSYERDFFGGASISSDASVGGTQRFS